MRGEGLILYLFFNGRHSASHEDVQLQHFTEAERERQAKIDNLSQPNPPEKSLTGTTNCPGLVDEERIPFLDQTAQHQTVSQFSSDTGTPELEDYISYIVMDLESPATRSLNMEEKEGKEGEERAAFDEIDFISVSVGPDQVNVF